MVGPGGESSGESSPGTGKVSQPVVRPAADREVRDPAGAASSREAGMLQRAASEAQTPEEAAAASAYADQLRQIGGGTKPPEKPEAVLAELQEPSNGPPPLVESPAEVTHDQPADQTDPVDPHPTDPQTVPPAGTPGQPAVAPEASHESATAEGSSEEPTEPASGVTEPSGTDRGTEHLAPTNAATPSAEKGSGNPPGGGGTPETTEGTSGETGITPPLTDDTATGATPATGERTIDDKRNHVAEVEQAHPGIGDKWDMMTPKEQKEAIPDDKERNQYTQDRKDVKLANAEATVKEVESAHQNPPKTWDEMTVGERKAFYGADYERYRDARADVALAAALKEIEKRGEPSNDKQRAKNEEDLVNAMAQATLAKDDEYQETLDREKQDSNNPQTQLDIGQKNLDARYDAMAQRAQQGIGPDGKPLTSQKEIDDVLSAIEAERVKKSAEMRVNAMPGYKKYQAIVKEGDSALADHNVRSIDDPDAYGRKGWDNPNVREAFGNNKRAFNEYMDARARMKDMEGRAEIDAVRDRNNKNVGEDGKPLTGDIEGQKQRRIKAAQDRWEPGPAWPRRGLNWLSKGLDNVFGKRIAHDHGVKAMGAMRRLVGQYGIRAMFPWTLEEEDRKNANALWREAAGNAFQYAWRLAPRTFLLGSVFFLVLWSAQLFLLGKGIEIAQPFAGNKG